VQITGLKRRIKVLGVPVDEISAENSLKLVDELLKGSERNQIVLLRIRDLLRARHDLEFHRMLKEAALILPVSKGIVAGASFLRAGKLIRFRPFEFLIRVLTLIEERNKTVYLIGGRKDTIEQAERNLKASFPGMRIVGRFSGFLNRDQEKNVILVIKKSSPSLLICGSGLPGKTKWIVRHKRDFNPGIYIWADNCFEIFAGKERQPPRGLYNIGLESLHEIKKKPWIILRIFPYIYFLLLLIIYRVFKL